MAAEAGFLAGYALMLIALANGLEWIGRRSADPWSSRMLTASRPADVAEWHVATQWPHTEVPKVHRGVGGVALAAALVLTVANLVRNHRPIEIVVLVGVLALILVTAARAVRRDR